MTELDSLCLAMTREAHSFLKKAMATQMPQLAPNPDDVSLITITSPNNKQTRQGPVVQQTILVSHKTKSNSNIHFSETPEQPLV